ncbi:hypothetical protein E4U53_002293 [Claviceps sorghi]|nr:hypothetical protein E4U53_002293 [Claviceps sorghi]
MAQVLTISLEPWQIPRPKKLSLQHMPYEIRKRIYEFALIEPRLLKRAHKLSCLQRQLQASKAKDLPFFVTTIWCDTGGRAECPCGKRTGLALLQTCRQISREASPVFWSGNTLQFFGMEEVVHIVGETLRAEQRNHLRSLSLVVEDLYLYKLQSRGWHSADAGLLVRRFWKAVGRCRGLERLEIPPFALRAGVELPMEEPACGDGPRCLFGSKLSSVKVTQLIPFFTSSRRVSPRYPQSMCPRPVVAKCSRNVLLQDVRTRETMVEVLEDLCYNFRIHVDTLVKTRFFGATPSNLRRWRETFKLDPSLHQGDNVRRVVLPTGERTKITFYGLPIGKATRLQMARDKMAQDSAQRDINGLSLAQHEIVQREKKKKKAAQLHRDVLEDVDYQEVLVERRLRRLRLKDEERAGAKDRQRNILQSIEEAAELRSQERKRVQPRAKEDCAAP